MSMGRMEYRVDRPLRAIRVDIAEHLLCNLLEHGSFSRGDGRLLRILEGLPRGSRLHATSFDAMERVLSLIFTHPELPEVMPGHCVPTRNCVIGAFMQRIDALPESLGGDAQPEGRT